MPNADVHYASLDTSLGTLLCAYANGRILRTALNGDEASFVRELGESLAEPAQRDAAPPAAISRAVRSAIEGEHDLTRVDLSRLGAFQRAVLDATAAIPRGETRTYGEVALAVGAPGAARAVGTALARNPVPIIVPCHRVVRANGDLGNYSGPGGPGSKERILRSEGAI